MLSKVFANKACSDAIIKISEGDLNGLTVVYDQLGRQIFSLAMSVLNNYSDAEDAMQDTFLRIARYAKNYDPAGNARAWIMAIARNAAVDTARRREIPSSGEPVYENAQARGDFTEVIEVNALLAALPESERQIVVLKAVDGSSYREIGEIMGITPEAARKKYERAIALLKEKGGF
ncbi:MAG: sigma-70 family RNA polymerase sigma factor [Clostridia bacterium]|nr:sigma-70 family RNA polymerase sigma factor [Clostridia bacterium]